MIENNENLKPKKISKTDRLVKLRNILESYKKANYEPEVTELAKYLECTRQTLYYDKDYNLILEEFEIGKKFKKNVIASQEYLLTRIDSLEGELISKDNKNKKLHKRIANLEEINIETEKNLAKEKKRILRFQIYYLRLIEAYNGIAKKTIAIEPNDIQNLSIDPLNALLDIKEDEYVDTSKAISINNKKRSEFNKI